MSETINKFGRLRAPKDGRDFNYMMRSVAPQISKPTPRKRSYNEGRLLDQGDTPHCVAFSGLGFMLAAPMMREENYSTTPVYRRCQQLDEWPGEDYDGTSVRALMKAMREFGWIENYAWGQTVEELTAWMNGGFGTVILGTNWYAEMSDVDDKGFMREPAPSLSTPIGGHAYRLNWFDAKKGAFLMRNSWGPYFGVRDPKTGRRNGEAYMRPELVRRLLAEDGEAASPTQTRVKPTVV